MDNLYKVKQWSKNLKVTVTSLTKTLGKDNKQQVLALISEDKRKTIV